MSWEGTPILCSAAPPVHSVASCDRERFMFHALSKSQTSLWPLIHLFVCLIFMFETESEKFNRQSRSKLLWPCQCSVLINYPSTHPCELKWVKHITNFGQTCSIRYHDADDGCYMQMQMWHLILSHSMWLTMCLLCVISMENVVLLLALQSVLASNCTW